MKQLKIKEKVEFLTPDFIYIPIDDKENLILKDDSIYKNDKIEGEKTSSVSGKANAFAKLFTIEGPKDTLMIENDFKDKKREVKYANKDIYKINKNSIKQVFNINSNELDIIVNKRNEYDLVDLNILKDNVREILETINLIDQTYDDLKEKIIINREDFSTYELLFNYMGTYPNIEIAFETKNKTNLSLYNVIDIYNIFKNRITRDYIYVSIKYKNEVQVIKTKKYTNLKELINSLNIIYSKIIINEKLELRDTNYVLDDRTYQIKII